MLHIDDNATRQFGRIVHCVSGGLTLIAAAAIYALFYAPTMKATNLTHREIDRVQGLLEEAPKIQREHTLLNRQLHEREEHLRQIRRRVPRLASESEFLSELTVAAEDVGMIITELSPGAPQQMAAYTRMDVTLTGMASYESVCRFVDRVRGYSRLVEVDCLDLRSDPRGQGIYPVTVTVTIFFDLVVPSEAQG